MAAAPKIAPNLPKVQGLITRPEKPRYLTNTKISFLFVLNPTICFYLCFFLHPYTFLQCKGVGVGLPFQTHPFSLGHLPSLLLSLQCSQAALANWSHHLIRSDLNRITSDRGRGYMITGEGAHGVCVVRAQIQLTQGGRRCAHSSTTVPPFGTPTSTICNHVLTNNQIQKLEDDLLTKCY